jgi:hypothetical protein
MKIKLNNGLTVDINPDTEFWCERPWRHDRIKSLLRFANLYYDRKFNTSLIHAFIFKECYAIVIDNGNGIVREFHSTKEVRQKRIRHFRYLRQKTKN